MSTPSLRHWLHGTHAAATVALILTGLLILSPELRTRTLGGYGREIGRLHLYIGLAFTIAPALAWLWARHGLLESAWRRTAPRDLRTIWQRLHIIVSLAASVVIALTGLVLWLGPDLPVAIWDGAADVHAACHWILTLSLPLHLLVARRKIAERVRLWAGGEPPALFEFADDPDEDP